MPGIKLSILDRIIGSDSMRVHRGATIDELEDTLHRDLTFLLNTRRAQEPISSAFQEAAQSILTFGLPDFTAINGLDRAEQERIRREIENAIRVFEPRLSNVTVSLDRPAKGSEQAKPAQTILRYHVRALLKVEPEP